MTSINVQEAKTHLSYYLDRDEAAILQLSRLPEYHRDPFDRIIICQAIAEDMTVLNPDIHIRRYAVKVEWENG